MILQTSKYKGNTSLTLAPRQIILPAFVSGHVDQMCSISVQFSANRYGTIRLRGSGVPDIPELCQQLKLPFSHLSI
jgi:hypothetical protein